MISVSLPSETEVPNKFKQGKLRQPLASYRTIGSKVVGEPNKVLNSKCYKRQSSLYQRAFVDLSVVTAILFTMLLQTKLESLIGPSKV